MALITKLTEQPKRTSARLTETEATYFFTDEGFLQINTYGSKDREVKGKSSQNIQFSPEVMERIIEIWRGRGNS